MIRVVLVAAGVAVGWLVGSGRLASFGEGLGRRIRDGGAGWRDVPGALWEQGKEEVDVAQQAVADVAERLAADDTTDSSDTTDSPDADAPSAGDDDSSPQQPRAD